MTQNSELLSALNELRRITGITFNIDTETPDETAQAVSQLHRLLAAYKEKYNKTHFLQSILHGTLSDYDISEQSAKLRIKPDESRILYLIESKNTMDDTVSTILRSIFPPQMGAYIVPISDTTLALLLPCSLKSNFEEYSRQTACSITDTLSMEALTFVWIACSPPLYHLNELQDAYQKASLSLKIGKLFYSEQNIFLYNQLGIGRLIYQLPLSVCTDFLSEVFQNQIPESLDSDLISTLDRFLQNNLNIAETARQLHMHRNTLIYRLEQIEKRTGLDLRKFEDAMTFKIALMVMNYRNKKQEDLSHE
ncbi:MAG: helix-turn-helix domain-containing protein [Schaedlerella sp.]|nr:helix-turn-helix domain-containing protein [Schaedlerella sp.]